MNGPEISVIIPVYNAGSTIERTLKSLTDHPFNIEIVCVDDGSADDSRSKIEKAMLSDQRIKLFHQANAGAAAARNLGLSAAAGEYIMFCDADDEYDAGLFEFVISDIKAYAPDYLVFGRVTLFDNGEKTVYFTSETCTELNCGPADYLNYEMVRRRHSHVVFNRAYKADIIRKNGISFEPSLKLSEDLHFNFSFLQHADRIAEDGRCSYIQHKTRGSLTTTKRPDFYQQETAVIRLLKQEYADFETVYEPLMDRHILNAGELAVWRALIGRDGTTLKEKRGIIRAALNDPGFRSAYARFDSYASSYERKKIGVLARKRVGYYWLRYIVLPETAAALRKKR